MRAVRVMHALALREWKTFFLTPAGYVVGGIFLFLNGLSFGVVLQNRMLATDALFGQISIWLLLLTPVVSMRLLAEEARSGTLEALVTDPVRSGEIVIAKFAAAFAFLLVLLAPLGVFCFFLHQLGSRSGGVDVGPVISGWIGLALLAALALGVGTLASALTRNQVVAAVSSLVALLCLYFLHGLERVMGAHSELLREALRYLNLRAHFAGFYSGRVEWADAIYFLSVTALALLLAVRVVEARKWRS